MTKDWQGRWWGQEWSLIHHHRIRLSATMSLDMLNLPRLHADWWDWNEIGISLDYGNGNSDPVFNVTLAVTVPPWVLRLLGLSDTEPPPRVPQGPEASP